ncbi:MAG: CoA pyrophosphatase [Candidatus Eremiobacteraeota bacterium]|nr:CoA pyrophosphatase [Candidatus Eremiobacteraeota bacterium]
MSEPRKAAVVLAIFSAPPHGVVFIERAAHLRHHAGQIGLPGGAMDPEDENDPKRTALREMEEEVGVAAERVDLVWEFSQLHPRVSNFIVTPFVAVVEPGPLAIDPSETAGVFSVPLATLLDEVRDDVMDIGAMQIETTMLDYDGRRIWGLTGRVLRMFVDEWNTNGSEMRTQIEQRLVSS